MNLQQTSETQSGINVSLLVDLSWWIVFRRITSRCLNWRFRNYVVKSKMLLVLSLSLRVVVFCGSVEISSCFRKSAHKTKKFGSGSQLVQVLCNCSHFPGRLMSTSMSSGWCDIVMVWCSSWLTGVSCTRADICVWEWVYTQTHRFTVEAGPITFKKWASIQLSRCYRSHSSDQHKLINLTGFSVVFPENTVHLHK